MTSTTARLTVLEAVVNRLADRRAAKISDMLRQVRQRVQAGETPTHPGLHDLSELEREATRGGIAGRMARARLRLLQDPAPDALPVPGVERQDARGGGEGQGGMMPPASIASLRRLRWP